MSSKAWIYHRSMTIYMFHGRSIPLAVQPLIIPVTAQAIQSGDDITTPMPPSAPRTFTPPTPKATDFLLTFSPTPILDDMFPTESHSPIPAFAAPCPSPDLSAASEGGGGAEAALHREKDAIYHPSAIPEHTMFSPELAPQSLSPQSINDVAIADPSRRSLDAEHTGEHPQHPSHGQYDIV
ncbi:hypothetical protein EDB85DRAFT_2145930 [Lactarius pseudohatsudake]|nr:hypothetical protein EDB85DRAFT_2145930 [Lactarius pseudohatsudake]